MSRFLHWILLLVVLAPLAAGQEGERRLDQARARWEQMSPAERARIAQHFKEFRGLSEPERERMKAHLGRVAQTRRDIEARIPEELRIKLEQLEPRERQQVLREYVESAMGERAERLRGKMSPDMLTKLDAASPAEREELLRGHHARMLERAPQALAYLGRKLELPQEEVDRIKALPPEAMIEAIGELGRREWQRRGPPADVDPQEFRGWLDLPPPEFLERMHCHGERGFRGDGPRGGPPEGRGRPDEFGEFGGPDRKPGGPPPDGRFGPGGRPGPRPDVREGGREGGRDGERGPRPDGPPREGKLPLESKSEVLRAMRPDSQWIVELAAQPREARRLEIEKRIKDRVLEKLRAQPVVTPAELTQLEALNGREFFDALRNIVGDPPRGHGDRHRREKPRD